MSEPLTTTEGLKPGDVLMVSTKLTDKQTGNPFWWRRFDIVTHDPVTKHLVRTLTAKLQPEERDKRVIDLDDSRAVVTKLEEADIPPGIVSIRMKLIMTRKVNVASD